MSFVDLDNVKKSFEGFLKKEPFPYCVIDNFFKNDIAQILANEFPNADSELFNGNYLNQIEIKRTCNIWDRFPKNTYNVFHYLNSEEFLLTIQELTGSSKLYPDNGLHGGGWHCHPPGGKLNVHLDYSIHPKMGLLRNYNLLVYLNPNWQEGWGGELGLWSHDAENKKPGKLIQTIEPKFNRAVLFDTTGYSWHGLEVPNTFPEGQDRKSLAIYYLTEPPENVDVRGRALFAPSEQQKDDLEVLELIKRRSQITSQDPSLWSRK